MSDDQFTKLFTYMQAEFAKVHDEMNQRFKQVHGRLDQVYNLVDEDLKRREADEQERLAVNNQLDRHKGWITQLAEGTKTKLVPEP